MKIIVFIIILFSQFCDKKNEQPGNEINAVVTFVVGDVKISDKKITLGTKLKLDETITVAAKSICDIQVLGLETLISIRLKENSEFTLKLNKNNDKNSLNPILKLGVALVKVNKLKQNESLELFSPVNVAGVRGTSFEVMVAKNSSTTSVLEGVVAQKRRVLELESIPSDIIEKIPALKLLKTNLDKESILNSGDISKSKTDNSALLKQSGLLDLVNSINEDIAQKKDVLNILKTAESKSIKIDLKKIETLNDASFEVTKLSSSDLGLKLKEAEEILLLEKDKQKDESMLNKEISNSIALKKDIILKRLEVVMGRKSEELKLKNGNSIRGIVLQEDGKYIVLTADGKFEYNESEVEGVSF